jgi:hypothetical protein
MKSSGLMRMRAVNHCEFRAHTSRIARSPPLRPPHVANAQCTDIFSEALCSHCLILALSIFPRRNLPPVRVKARMVNVSCPTRAGGIRSCHAIYKRSRPRFRSYRTSNKGIPAVFHLIRCGRLHMKSFPAMIRFPGFSGDTYKYRPRIQRLRCLS